MPPNSWGGCAGYQFHCDSQARFYACSEGVLAFIEALYEHGWVVPFDWPEWQEEVERLVESPEGLADTDAATIRRLLTRHVRKDHIRQGHLAEMLENGHILTLLRRLREIRDGACL